MAYVPSLEQDDVIFFFHKTEERLSKIQVGTELYDVIYSNGDITDVVPEVFDGHHRALQVGSPVEEEITCESCADTVFQICKYQLLICTILGGFIGTPLGGNALTLAMAFEALCVVLGAGCASGTGTDICNNQICCGRSLCGGVPREGGLSCYDDDVEKCCDNFSIIETSDCCEEEVTEECCGLDRCGNTLGIDGNPYCYSSGPEKCCPAKGVHPTVVVSKNECCPSEVRRQLG